MSGEDRERNDVDEYLDTLDSVLSWARENKDIIGGVFGDEEAETITAKEPLAEAHVKDDEVVIVAEVDGYSGGDMSVMFDDGVMKFSIGGNNYRAEVPGDVVEDSMEAEIRNGILRVEVDRMKKNTTVTVDEIDEEMDFDDNGDENGDV